MGTFSEYSWETPLGIFIHLVEELAVFIQAQDGEGHETKKMAFLPSHSKEKYNLGLRARQTSEEEKSSIKTARGSISKTEQKIGFPHAPVALRALHTAQNKARGPGISDAGFLRSPCRASLVLGFLRVSLLPFLHSFSTDFHSTRGIVRGPGLRETFPQIISWGRFASHVPLQGCGPAHEKQTHVSLQENRA